MYCVCITGLFYYTLGNLDPVLRSTLKSIHLLSIAKYEVICKHGIDEFLKPIIDDVLKLEGVFFVLRKFYNFKKKKNKEDQVEFDINGIVYSFRGTVTTLSADNLAAWSIGGYKALQAAFRKCQYCMVTDTDMQVEVDTG